MSAKSIFTNDEVEQILRVVEKLEGVEIRIEQGDFKLHLRSAPRAPQTQAEPASATALTSGRPAASVTGAQSRGAFAVRAPMLGNFFRASSPSDAPIVEVGTRVKAEDPVCLIEVMKKFTIIKAGVDGTVEEIPAGNSEMVEYDQILLLIRPE